jgi:hypothetical protein
MEALDVSTRKTVWSIETGGSWPRKERVKRLEERLGFKPGVLNSFFVLQGTAADISRVSLDDLMLPLPDAADVGFDGVSDSALVGALFDRLQAKDRELARLRAELAAHTQGAFDLAAHTAAFKAALEKETKGT